MTRRPTAALPAIAALFASAISAGAAPAQAPPLQILPIPGVTAPPLAITPPTPAPLAPPTNPGYAAAPADGLSPILTQPGPVFQLPPQPNPSYPPPQLPGPVDQQKLQAYRNDLRQQQWQLQRQGVSPASPRSRYIEQQLNPPTWQ